MIPQRLGEPYSAVVPFGRTARRLSWPHLPPPLRAQIEQAIGFEVADHHSCDHGFTPGFASVLDGPTGQRVFVKAASKLAQKRFAEAYADEARKVAGLPAAAPAARVLWTIDDDSWFAVGLECLDGAPVPRPWTDGALSQVLDTLEELAAIVTPAPEALGLSPFVDDFAELIAVWPGVLRSHADRPYLAEAAALSARFSDLTGETLVHTDVRADNVVLTSSGPVLCDWNWPAVGPAWLDSVFLLIEAAGDGLDVEAVIAARPWLAKISPQLVDVALAAVLGYFCVASEEPSPSSSPFVRRHQEWMAAATASWLGRRLGWPVGL